jgi:hypothetical protein
VSLNIFITGATARGLGVAHLATVSGQSTTTDLTGACPL